MALANTSEPELPLCAVDVVEPDGKQRRGRVRCAIGRDVILSVDDLQSYCVAGWKPIVYDALLVASAVEFCDRSQKRPARSWGREFDLTIPVHEPDIWNGAAVSRALHDVLETLTGDRWEVSFFRRRAAAETPPQMGMDLPDEALAIIPFSDGLDSRAVAGLMARDLGDRLIRVRLGSKTVDRPKDGKRRVPFASVPYRVLGNHPESSCRSRGFKFAVVSGIAAYLAGSQRIIVPESGQGALGPALVPVMHAHVDCRNHPSFFRKMEVLLQTLLPHIVRYEFPRLWFTKGETLREFVTTVGGDEWLRTRSCWQKSRHMSVNGRLRQCGMCAACLLRRLSVHSAGLSEAADTYMWENLSAPTLDEGIATGFAKLGKSQRNYALAGVLHLDHLAGLRRSSVHEHAIKLQIAKLSGALGAPAGEVETNLFRMLEEHGREWSAFRGSLVPESFISTRSCAVP